MKRQLVILGVFYVVCFLPYSMRRAVFAEGIKVGVILPLTGRLAGLGGTMEHKSFQLAVEEINASGGIRGEKIELIVEDTAGNRDAGLSAIEKLISQDKVIVVGGGYSSTVAWSASAAAEELKVPFLINTASADRLTEERRKFTFRLNTPLSEQDHALKSFLKEVSSVKTAAIIYEETHFGRFWAKKFLKQCRNLGLEVVAEEGYEAEARDVETMFQELAFSNPDLIFMISNANDAYRLMETAKKVGLNPKIFMGNPSGFARPEFRIKAGSFSGYVYSQVIWDASVHYAGAQRYYNKFLQKYKIQTDYHGAQAYASMYVISDALKRAQTLTPEDVRDALAGTRMMTVVGPVQFVSYGKKIQQNQLPTYLVQWINSRLETVWPKQVASREYIYPTPQWADRF